MKIRTSKKDYMRVDQKAQRQNRFAPEIGLTFHDRSVEVKAEESKEATLTGCSVTCSECSYGLPLKTVEKQEKAQEKQQPRQFAFNKHQNSVCKELLDRGLFSVATHYCKTCDSQIRTDLKHDIVKLCFLCAIKHKKQNLDHNLVFIANTQFV